MSRTLSTYKYSTQKYGSDGYVAPKFALLIDFENLGIFLGRNDALRVQKFSVERGRRHWVRPDGNGFEEETTGRLSAVVADPDQDYNPYNSSSPLYGDLDVNRSVRLVVRTPDGSLYDLFSGSLTNLLLSGGVIPTARFEASDGWDFLHNRGKNISVELQQDVDISTAIALVLNAVGWRYDFNPGTHTRTIPYWWVEDKNAAREIFDLVFHEMGSVFIKGDGSLNTEEMTHEEDPIATLTDADIEDGSLELSMPWETRKNTVRMIARPRILLQETIVWWSRSAIAVDAGESVTVDVDRSTPYHIYAPTATTEFLANTASNGSGSNLTASFSVSVERNGNGARITFTNNSVSNGYVLAGARARGVPIVWQLSSPVYVAGGGEYTFDFDFDYDGEKIPVESFIDPVQTTDFEANTQDDGSGTDLTSSFTMLVERNGNGATATVYNNSASAGYLLAGAQLRGVPVSAKDKVTSTYGGAAGKEDVLEFNFENPYYQETDNMATDALALLNNLAANRPSMTFVLKPNPDLQFKIDLGSRLTLNFARTGEVVRRVAYIKHEFDQKSSWTRTTVFCEPLRTGQVIDEGGVGL